jgi:hypothetical protein
MPHLRTLLALPTAAVAIAGCGITNPYHTNNPRPSLAATPAPASDTSTGDDPSDPAPGAPGPRGSIPPAAAAAQATLAAGAGQPTPQAALDRYARLYANWSARTIGAVQHQLASISLGQARAQALQAAASYARDSVLQHSRVTNSGQVTSIAAGQGPLGGRWVITTQETTTGSGDYAGLPPQAHVTYAQVTNIPHGWIVIAWHPQS